LLTRQPRPEKVEQVELIAEKLRQANVAVLTDYRGMNTMRLVELRQSMKAVGAELMVVKNTLARLACEKVGYYDFKQAFAGPVAIAFGYEDISAPAKTLMDFFRRYRHPVVKAAYVQGRLLDEQSARQLAELPTKEQAMAEFLGMLQAPLAEFLGILEAPVAQLIYLMEAKADQLEKTA
jgi:large subunit ribosomal protein L10